MKTLILKHASTASAVIIAVLFSISLWQLAAAGWIQGKAVVAQQLLNTSWNRTLNDAVKPGIDGQGTARHETVPHKPWPWADTWPVAKLLVPRHDIEQIILAGDSGSSLAFGPGLSLAGAAPNTPGTTLISGHRDTHFRFLSDIELNETLYLQTAEQTESYQVYERQIVDSKNYRVQPSAAEQTLILATCYPFDSITSGSTLRYLVFAKKQSI
jgi:sortase A